FFQAEDGIRAFHVTGVQTCALPISIHSNKAITAVLQHAQRTAGLPEGTLSLIEDTRRETAQEMMRLNGLIDVLIPRGGAGLIQRSEERRVGKECRFGW